LTFGNDKSREEEPALRVSIFMCGSPAAPGAQHALCIMSFFCATQTLAAERSGSVG